MSFLIAAALGLFAWSFSEYALHNWYGHVAKGKNHFSREHLRHHAKKDHFAPNIEKLMAAFGTGVVVFPLAIWAVGPALGVVFGVSFVATYLYYEWLHWASHMLAPTTGYGRWVRKNHFAHHFNSPKHNHGVTSGIWDVVFRTSKPPAQVRVPRKFAMDWLLDPAGVVKPAFQADYVLTGRAKASA